MFEKGRNRATCAPMSKFSINYEGRQLAAEAGISYGQWLLIISQAGCFI
jgi:hypothetical protein